MRRNIIPYSTIVGLVLLSTFIVWLPFLFPVKNWLGLDFRGVNFLRVYQHFDGLLYIVPAKTLYNKELFESLRLEQGLGWNYFAAHLPLYPLFIRLLSPVFDYLQSMMIVTLVSTMGLAVFFYYLLKTFKFTEHPLLLTGVFLFLPRLLVVRTIGAPEPLFILLILISLYFFEKKQYWLAGLAGGISVMAKTPGTLLGIAYGLVFLERLIQGKKFNLNWFGISLIAAGLLAVFSLYYYQYGDFFAYFNSGDNLHLVSPFAVFNAGQRWVGTAWLEDILFYYFLYGVTVVWLYQSKFRSLFYFALVFFIATLMVQHRDIARYSLPIWPLTCIAFEKLFTSKKFMLVLLMLLPGIFLYAWNFMLWNYLPVSDWRPFL